MPNGTYEKKNCDTLPLKKLEDALRETEQTVEAWVAGGAEEAGDAGETGDTGMTGMTFKKMKL